MNSLKSYVKRPVRFVSTISRSGWQLKVYGISVQQKANWKGEMDIAMDRLEKFLPQPPMNENRFGAGFLIIHCGNLRNWFLLDWWEYEEILCQKLFSSPLDNFADILPVVDLPAVGCVHELRVTQFESKAWTETMLAGNSDTGINEYLRQTMNEES